MLRVTVASTANYFVPDLLAEFTKRYTGVAVSLDVTNREGLLAALRENATDLVIMGRPPDDRDLGFEPFRDNPLVVVAPPDHPLARQSNIPLKRLEDETFLVRERGSGTRIAMERFFNDHGIRIQTGMEAGSNEAIKQSVQAGLGLGLLSYDTLAMELQLKTLAILDIENFPIMRYWHVVHRHGKRLSTVAQAFKQFLVDSSKQIPTR